MRRCILLVLLVAVVGCQDRPLFGVRLPADGGADTSSEEDAFIPDTKGLPDGLRQDATCATSSAEVGLHPLDMLLALDTSFSMDFLGKWRAVRDAVKKLVGDPLFAGIGVGLQYFPLRKECSVPDYVEPEIPIGLLPDVGQAISESLDLQRMSGGTPMVPMLQGVIQYASSWAKDSTDRRKVVVIVATDGVPDDLCLSAGSGQLPNTLDNVVAVAKEGLQADPSIVTFVIGVGSELSALSQIAKAGGSESALLVDTATNIEQAFLEALNTVRLRAVSCEVDIPPPETGKIDYERVNVIFSTNNASDTFGRVSGPDECHRDPQRAWYYDNPTAPEKILLCEETCNRVKMAVDARVDVQFGCKSLLL